MLVAVEVDSGLARDVTGNSAGVAVPGGDVDALATAISSLADDPEGLGSMRQKALEFSARAFATDVVLARWSSLLQ